MLDRRQLLGGAGVVTLSAFTGAAFGADKITIDNSSALIVVDVQNSFLPGGSLAVKDGDKVVPVINRIARSSGRLSPRTGMRPAIFPSPPPIPAGSRST